LDRFVVGVVVVLGAGALISHLLPKDPYLVALLSVSAAAVCAFGWALIRAPYEQRNSLRAITSGKDTEIARVAGKRIW
jgi:hypothetical protein